MGLIISSEVQLPGIEFWDCRLLAVWSWAVAVSALTFGKMWEMV